MQKVRPPFRKLWKYDQDELIEFPPIIADKRMYMIDNDGVFIALDNDTGKVVWKKQLGSAQRLLPGLSGAGRCSRSTSSPAQALAVRARDGKVLWKQGRCPRRAESSPVVIGETMYFGTESGAFYCSRRADRQADLGDGSSAARSRRRPPTPTARLYVGDYRRQR